MKYLFYQTEPARRRIASEPYKDGLICAKQTQFSPRVLGCKKPKQSQFFSVALCAALWQEMQNEPKSPAFSPQKHRSPQKTNPIQTQN